MKRTLGRSNIEVSAMGLGCWAIGGPTWAGDTPVGWGEVDDAESIAAIHRALDLGVTFFDTADVYGTGHSERVLAGALAGRKHEVVIATKFGNTYDELARQITGQDASPEYIRNACEASLRRLDRDYIDLYQFHLNGFDVEKAGPVRETLEELVEEGKIRAYGWSTDLPEAARFFAEGRHCASTQVQMNVLDDAPEIVAVCEEADLACINRGPLAMGILTGKYSAASTLGEDDVRGRRSPAWMKYFSDGKPADEWLEKLSRIRELLTSDGRTLSQGAIGWLWARSEKTIPIPGFRTPAQVEENAGALERGPLPREAFEEIEKLLER
jgi:aryl-alcohol dehydrogenase-like predicted oxidoreductase